MKDLIWAIPLFPLAGFLVNGLVYLLEHRTKGEPRTATIRTASSPAAESQKDLGHPHAHTARGDAPAPSRRSTRPWAPGSRRALLPLRVRRDLRRRAVARWPRARRTSSRSTAGSRSASTRPSGQVPGKAAEWFVDAAFRLDSLSALMLAFVDLRRVPDPRLLGRLHGTRRGLRALLRVPEPLHVLDARPGAGARTSCSSSSGGKGVGPLLVSADRRTTTTRSARPTPARRRSSSTGSATSASSSGSSAIFALFGSLDFGQVFSAAAAGPAARTRRT